MPDVDPGAARPRPVGVLRAGGGFRPFATADVSRSIPDRFESQATRHPHRIAVTGGGQRLTYRELDALADRVGLGLLARGVVPGERVGVALDHEPTALGALLGVLKAARWSRRSTRRGPRPARRPSSATRSRGSS